MDVEVTITGPENAVIFYTTNGSIATEQSNEYTSPFVVPDGAIVRAIAVLNGVASNETVTTCGPSDME